MKSSQYRRWAFCILGYIVVIAAVTFGVRRSRDWVLVRLGTPASIEEWQAWREDVRQQQLQQQGPVQRRVPKSNEPPALVLMRDYFRVSLAGAIIFSSALYWVLTWFLVGILQQNPMHDRASRGT